MWHKIAGRPSVIDGIVSYGGHKTGDWFAGEGYGFEGDEDDSRSTAWPAMVSDASAFLSVETRFGNRWNIASPGTVTRGSTATIGVVASSDTRSVRFYRDWHYLGETGRNDGTGVLDYSWTVDAPTGAHTLTAVAYDDRGLVCLPSPAGTAQVTVE